MLSGMGILLSHPAFELSSIEFQGQSMDGLEEMQMAASIEKDNIFLINLNRIEHNVRELDRVRICRARRVLPSSVQIQVAEHTPSLLVNFDNIVGLSEDGHFVPVLQDGSIADLPILTGLDKVVTVEEYKKTEEPVALLALKFLNDLGTINPELKDLISEIRYDSNGFVVLLRDRSLPV